MQTKMLWTLHSVEELEKMLAEQTEALGEIVEDDDNTADDSSQSDEVDVSDDDL